MSAPAESLENKESLLRSLAQDAASKILSGEISTPTSFQTYFAAVMPEFQATQAELVAQQTVRAAAIGETAALLGIPFTEELLVKLKTALIESGLLYYDTNPDAEDPLNRNFINYQYTRVDEWVAFLREGNVDFDSALSVLGKYEMAWEIRAEEETLDSVLSKSDDLQLIR